MEKCGVIDIGSNSIRLVIYELLHSVYMKEIENCKVTAKLDNYLTDSMALSTDGMNLIVKTLQYFRQLLEEYNVTKVECVATATVRKAKNNVEVTETVRKETGFSMRILTGEEEALYGLSGILHSTTANSGFTIDIGGGSTEIIYFEDRKAKHIISFPFGVLSLKKKFVKKEVPTEKELIQIEEFLRKKFEKAEWLYKEKGNVFAIGGSARNVVQVYQHTINYPLSNTHLFTMGIDGINRIYETIRMMSYLELQQLEALSKERADTIGIATLVFKVMMEIVGAQQYTLCGKGLREGIYYRDFAFNKLSTHLKEESIKAFVEYNVHTNLSKKSITKLTMMLYSKFEAYLPNRVYGISNDFLRWGASLYGYAEKYNIKQDQLTFHLLSDIDLDGFTHKEKIMLALMASYKSKSRLKKNLTLFQEWFIREEIEHINACGAIIKIANALCISSNPLVKDLHVEENGATLHLYIYCKRDWIVEEQRVQKQIKHLEKVMKKDIVVRFLQYHSY